MEGVNLFDPEYIQGYTDTFVSMLVFVRVDAYASMLYCNYSGLLFIG